MQNQSTPVTVTIGKKDTGVTICSLSSANAECEWSDAVAIVNGFGDGGIPGTDTAVISRSSCVPGYTLFAGQCIGMI